MTQHVGLTRRSLLAVAAAGSAFGSAGPAEEAVVRYNDEQVAAALKDQMADKSSRDEGGWLSDYGLAEPVTTSRMIERLASAWLHRQSRFYKEPAVARSLERSIAFLRRKQHPNGLIDLLNSNFQSPPDTGFAVQDVASAAFLLKRGGEENLFGELEPFLRRAADAISAGGVHTANHRWVTSAALAQVHELFPTAAYTRRIDQWLAEGIDIDFDGQYTERSTSIYDAVCDHAFIVLAEKLRRPELLNPPRRNLEMMIYLVQPGGDVATEISRRQDQYAKAGMARYWFPIQYFAHADQNGRLAGISQRLPPENARLSAFVEYPLLRSPLPDPVALPDDYERVFPATGVYRFRKGPIAATFASGTDGFFSIRNGESLAALVSFSSTFFGRGQFVGESLNRLGDEYRLRQVVDYGYWQPFVPPRKVAVGQWGAVRPQRDKTNMCRLEQSASLRRDGRQFQVRVQAQGTANVPLTIRIGVSEQARVTGVEAHPHRPGEYVLRSGTASIAVESSRMRFGPGRAEHLLTTSSPENPLPGTPIYITLVTPVDYTLTFDLE